MQKYVSLDITEQTYADRQADNFVLAELQKAVQLQNRGASPEATTNTITAADAILNSGDFIGFCVFGTHCHRVLSEVV